ncbi:MAG: hypothetical protein V3U84_01560 [Thiotrichaceae bacterium]
MKLTNFHIAMTSALLLIGSLSTNNKALAVTIGADFTSDYSATSLGSIDGLPTSYGGLTIKAGSQNTLLIGGAANTGSGRLYEIGVTRDAENHITGFIGSASVFGDVGEFNDGGVAYGPNGVLFTTQWNVNNLGQTILGDSDENRVDDLTPFGVGGSSIAALNFVPSNFSGAGDLKIVSWSSGNWYDVELAPDGTGTFDITNVSQVDLDPNTTGTQVLPGGPEGFVYIDSVNAGFSVDSMLVSEWSAGRVAAYEIDSNGNPILSTRRDFITDLSGAEGAAIDPLTGDFLFSTFGGGDQVVVVKGFVPMGGNGDQCTLDVDGDTIVDALTDGLLNIRHMFGIRGVGLVEAAVASNCANCTVSAIETFLDQCADIGATDIDGNGEIDALSDGLLIIRYIFGIRGTALIEDSVGDGCSRCTAVVIEGYLEGLNP